MSTSDTATPSDTVPTQLQLEPGTFTAAVKELHRTWQATEGNKEWQDVKLIRDDLGGVPYLHITRDVARDVSLVSNEPAAQSDPSTSEEELPDLDDEAVPPPTSMTSQRVVTVTYDIIYSPSYRVPVLYLTPGPLRANEVWELLVPAARKGQIRDVGPMGALSMTDHPATSAPAYFIHPCRTGEAMAAVVDERELGAVEYLLMWLGLIGPSVRLSVPLSVAEALSRN